MFGCARGGLGGPLQITRFLSGPSNINFHQQEVIVSEVVYTSKVRIERQKGPWRLAYLPGESKPVVFSVHGAIAEHYKVDPATLGESHASTLDYVIAATAG
jgi:hypothetical protein